MELRALDGTLLFARGSSLVSTEWLLTGESEREFKTFHESFRFPELSDEADLVIKRRDARNQFVEKVRIRIRPEELNPAVPDPQLVHDLEINGKPQEKVDLLFLGDGYTVSEQDVFLADANRLMEALFQVEPFHTQRRSFNVRAICPPATQSGIARPSTGFYRNSPLGCSYDSFGSERYVLTMENRAWRDVAARAPYEYVIMLTNGETYGGGGMFSVFATAAAHNSFAEYLVIHEFGHHFAGLADEYYTSPVAYQPPEVVVEPWEVNATALLNPDQLKWREWVDQDTPIPTPWPKETFEAQSKDYGVRRAQIRQQKLPEHHMDALFLELQKQQTELLGQAEHAHQVGAFQGANYDANAFYRPQADCIMFTRNRVPFCRVCANTLNRVILWQAPKPH